ncbi:MAG: hypothetical protein HQM13_11590 [SAR324 cluster bacterium]|nr:hypothetical protein [SAR324 cluster bacterium]
MTDFFQSLEEARESRKVGKVCFSAIYKNKKHFARGYRSGEMLLETEEGYFWTPEAKLDMSVIRRDRNVAVPAIEQDSILN